MVAASTPSPLAFWMGTRQVTNDKEPPPPPPPHTSPPQSPPSNMQAFMNGLISPFVTCWQPPLPECGPMTRPSKPAVVSPVIDRTKSNSSFQSSCSSVHPNMLMLSREQQPLIDIEHPHHNDVLCGRGGSSNRHVGNLNFRELVGANKKTYTGLTKKQKMLVARKIVDTVHNTHPPGRFLSRDIKTGLWYDIGLQRSLEKTSQALREKSAGEREKAASHGEGDDMDDDEGVGVEEGEGGTTSPTNLADDTSATPSAPLSPASSVSSVTSTKDTVVLKKKSSRYIEAPPLIIPPHLEPVYNPRLIPHTRSPPMGYGCWPQFLPTHPHQPRHMYPPGPPPGPRPHHVPMHYPTPDYREHHGHPPRHPAHQMPRLPPPRCSSGPPLSQPGASNMTPPPPPPGRPPVALQSLKPSPVISQASREAFVPPLSLNLRNNSVGTSNPSDSTNAAYHGTSNLTSAVREGQEISPGRRQAWKKQRTVDGMTERRPDDTTSQSDPSTNLSLAIESKLSLEERVIRRREITSPSAVLQSRSRRTMLAVNTDVAASGYYEQQHHHHQHDGDDLSGLAALSAAAFLKLDEEN